jgi:hypothetical protein
MKQHYNLSDAEYDKLVEAGITDLDLVKAIPEFDKTKSGSEITKVSLLYYIDAHGDFNVSSTKNNLIAKAIFHSLSPSDRMDILNYFMDYEDMDDEDDEDEDEDEDEE